MSSKLARTFARNAGAGLAAFCVLTSRFFRGVPLLDVYARPRRRYAPSVHATARIAGLVLVAALLLNWLLTLAILAGVIYAFVVAVALHRDLTRLAVEQQRVQRLAEQRRAAEGDVIHAEATVREVAGALPTGRRRRFTGKRAGAEAPWNRPEARV